MDTTTPSTRWRWSIWMIVTIVVLPWFLMQLRLCLKRYRLYQIRKRHPQVYGIWTPQKKNLDPKTATQVYGMVVSRVIWPILWSILWIVFWVLTRVYQWIKQVCVKCQASVVALHQYTRANLVTRRPTRATTTSRQTTTTTHVAFEEHSNGNVYCERYQYDPSAQPNAKPIHVAVSTPPPKVHFKTPKTKRRVPTPKKKKRQTDTTSVVVARTRQPTNKPIVKSTSRNNHGRVSSYKPHVGTTQAPATTRAIVQHFQPRPLFAPVATTPLAVRYRNHKRKEQPLAQERKPTRRRVALVKTCGNVVTRRVDSKKRQAQQDYVLEEFLQKRPKPTPAQAKVNALFPTTSAASTKSAAPAFQFGPAGAIDNKSAPATTTDPGGSVTAAIPSLKFGPNSVAPSAAAAPSRTNDGLATFQFGTTATPAAPVVAGPASVTTNTRVNQAAATNPSAPAALATPSTKAPSAAPTPGFQFKSAPAATPASALAPAASMTPTPGLKTPLAAAPATTPGFQFQSSANTTPAASGASFAPAAAAPLAAAPTSATPAGFSFQSSSTPARNTGSTPTLAPAPTGFSLAPAAASAAPALSFNGAPAAPISTGGASSRRRAKNRARRA